MQLCSLPKSETKKALNSLQMSWGCDGVNPEVALILQTHLSVGALKKSEAD